MLASNRIFEQMNTDTGISEWFYVAREGIKGPHASQEQALYGLNAFKITAKKLNLTGGRVSEPQHRQASSASKSVFPVNRIFQKTNLITGIPEWFYSARKGVKGPYESKEKTLYELNVLDIIKNKIRKW